MRGRISSLAAPSAGACLLTAAAALIAFDGSPDDRVIAAIAHGAFVATAAGVGLVVRARRPGDRFALLLLGSAGLWSLTALVQTSGDLSYSIGRVASWLAEGSLVYVLLAFPSGRLTTALERRT